MPATQAPQVPAIASRFCIIGHRGAAGHAPENTLYAIEVALAQGVHGIEIDVHRVEDELVVIHDQQLARTTNGQGSLTACSLAYVRSLDAGLGERVPLLTEVLQLVDRRVPINIELKGAGTAGPVVALIERYVHTHQWRYEDFLVSSFDHAALLEVYRQQPAIRIGVLASQRRKPQAALQVAARIGAYALHPSLALVTPGLVAAAHAMGLRVFVYTVNAVDDIHRMLAYGVDGVFSDYPDRVGAVLRQYG